MKLEEPFALIGNVCDQELLDIIAYELSQEDLSTWSDNLKKRSYSRFQQETVSVILVWSRDYINSSPDVSVPEYPDIYYENIGYLGQNLASVANNILDTCPSGTMTRMVVACLPPGKVIPPHRDSGRHQGTHYDFNHRIHVPLLTNPSCFCIVGQEAKHLRQGEVWEISNQSMHSVVNNGGTPRFHLIVDIDPREPSDYRLPVP